MTASVPTRVFLLESPLTSWTGPYMSQNCFFEAKSENRALENQGLASPNFPVFGNLRQSYHAPTGHHDACK